MSFVVSSTVNSVHVDDWTAERAIIASNSLIFSVSNVIWILLFSRKNGLIHIPIQKIQTFNSYNEVTCPF